MNVYLLTYFLFLYKNEAIYLYLYTFIIQFSILELYPTSIEIFLMLYNEKINVKIEKLINLLGFIFSFHFHSK